MSAAPATRLSAPALARSHSGHSHHHHHSHADNVYLTSQNKTDAGVKITRIGLYVNLGMAVGKGVGGYVFHSQALSADAIHSLTDLVSDFMTLATVSLALRPPTKQFPFGFGKVESLGSLGVSSILLVGGLLMGWSSLIDLFREYLPIVAETMEWLGVVGHSHGHSHQIPSLGAAWLALGSIAVKEWLYRATLKIARERKSSVLESNAVHHRVDSLTSIAALLAIGTSNLFPSFHGTDAIGGLLICWLVVRTGWENTRSALYELADATVDDEIRGKAQRAARKALTNLGAQGETDVLNVQGIKAGQSYTLDVEVEAPHQWDLTKLQQVEQAIRDQIGNTVRGARRVRIRFAAQGSFQSGLSEFVDPSLSQRSGAELENEHVHEGGHDHSHSNGSEVSNGEARGTGSSNSIEESKGSRRR